MSVYKLGMNISKKDLRDLIHRGQMASGIPLDRLEEIAQAERDGRCVVRPCKVGDTLWFDTYGYIKGDYTNTGIKPHIIEKITTVYSVDHYTDIKDWEIGKPVFLSYEAAEAARKEDGNG